MVEVYSGITGRAGSFGVSSTSNFADNSNFDGKGTYLVFDVGGAIFFNDFNSQDKQQLQHIGKKLIGPQHYNKDGVEHNEEDQQDEYSHTQACTFLLDSSKQLGMLTREALASVTLPDMLRNLVFHPASLLFRLSMMNWNSPFIGCLWKMGYPKYFPKWSEGWMPRTEERVRAEALKKPINGVTFLRASPSKKGKVISKEEVGHRGASITNGNRVPVESVHLIVDPPRKKFHKKDEEVGRYGVTLSNAPGGVKRVGFSTIDQN
ncbi:hypothetical protein CQW23_07083 [Capsicum baccatum]|uniref:Uncharacterized protein n=1 Tax=Capsicum baccatum TaxID=33114 RepID=A0A2G2X578_CAPBA|nr:hypothetical protein CQW23_07083 [Capsicum baccatum]